MSVRLTLNRFPSSAGLKETVGLPWGAIVRPFAPLKDNIELPPETVVRCSSCFAYMNTFCTFDRKRWHCPLCQSDNQLEARYSTYSSRSSLPELNNHVYEIDVDEDEDDEEATPDQTPPDQPIFLAVVDLTGGESVLELVKSALLSALEAVGEDALFGLVTFSDKLGLYDLRTEVPTVRYVRLPAHGECELGLEEIAGLMDLAVRVGDFKDHITAAVDSLQSCEVEESAADAAPPMPGAPAPKVQKMARAKARRGAGVALLTLIDYLGEYERLQGVRMLTFLSGIPNHGQGALDQDRYAVDRHIEESNTSLLLPSTAFYRELGERASIMGACVDLFVISDRYCDLATLKFLPMMSGGRLLLYETCENATLPQDIFRLLGARVGWKCLLRVRTSSEFKVATLYGSYTADENYDNLYHIACVDEKQTLALDFEFSSPSGFPSDPDQIPTVQIAFAYTESHTKGYARRRLRVMTFQVGVAHAPQEIYDTADATVINNLMTHKIIRATLDSGVPEARALMEDWLVLLLKHYNDTFTQANQPVDMEFTHSRTLQGLTRLVYGNLKNNYLAAENVHPDERIYLQQMYSSLRPEFVARCMYPALVAYANDDERITDGLALCRASITSNKNGVFILDSFFKIYVYFTEGSDSPVPPRQDSELRNEITKLKGDRSVTPRVYNVKEGGNDQRYFDLMLIEEAAGAGKGLSGSYSEFTEYIRNRVCKELDR